MIAHVVERALAGGIGPVAVAADAATIAEALAGSGARGRPDAPRPPVRLRPHLRGAAARLDPGRPLRRGRQPAGRLPDHLAAAVAAALGPLDDADVDDRHARRRDRRTSTSAPTRTSSRSSASPVARAAGCGRSISPAPPRPRATGRSTTISASTPIGATALERFVALPPSPLEKRERLEQLRALEAGMRIDVAIIDEVPFGVDTPADLERARAILGGKR